MLRRSVEARISARLNRVPAPPGASGLAALRATYAGGTRQEQVTILDFYEPEGIDTALGGLKQAADVAVLRRHNVVVLYDRPPRAPDIRATLSTLLEWAPLIPD